MIVCVCVCSQQRKPEDAAETAEDSVDEAKKAKPSEETNGAGDDEATAKTNADEQAPVSSSFRCL